MASPDSSRDPHDASVGANRKPDLFLIGAPKCGTTSLYEYLKGHPEIYMSPAKEPRYFSPDVPIAVIDHDLRHGRDHQLYMDLFAGARDERRVGEASVNYLYSSLAPQLIGEFQPRPYILVMLRDPVEMIHSLHGQRVAEGLEELDFADALAAEEDRRQGRRLPLKATVFGSVYTDQGMYGRHLRRWVDAFGRDRVHVALMDDLVADPASTFRSVLEFLEVDPAYQPETFQVHNVSHRPRSELLRRALKTRPAQWLAWQALPRVAGDANTRRLVRRFRHSRLYRRPAPRAPLSGDLRRRLQAMFEDDVAQTSELVGRDLTALWWDRRSASALRTPVGSRT